MSFASSSGAPIERVFIPPDKSMRSSQQLEAKVDMVYSLLSMLGGQEHADMGETLFALSTNPESCLAMRESGWLIFLAIAKINLFLYILEITSSNTFKCILIFQVFHLIFSQVFFSGCVPLLVQLVQSDRDSETRKKATRALHNLVQSQPDEKLRKREIRILKLLETVCAYNEALINDVEFVCENPSDGKILVQRSLILV